MTTDANLLASQPIVFTDGTMQYHFRDYMLKIDRFIDEAGTTATWGSIGGALSNHTGLQNALDAKPDSAGTETISGSWTFTGTLDLTAATIVGLDLYTYEIDGGDASSTHLRYLDGGNANNVLPYSVAHSFDGGSA